MLPKNHENKIAWALSRIESNSKSKDNLAWLEAFLNWSFWLGSVTCSARRYQKIDILDYLGWRKSNLAAFWLSSARLINHMFSSILIQVLIWTIHRVIRMEIWNLTISLWKVGSQPPKLRIYSSITSSGFHKLLNEMVL